MISPPKTSAAADAKDDASELKSATTIVAGAAATAVACLVKYERFANGMSVSVLREEDAPTYEVRALLPGGGRAGWCNIPNAKRAERRYAQLRAYAVAHAEVSEAALDVYIDSVA